MPTAFSEQLVRLNACREAREWVGQRLPHEAWRDCERPEWLLWLAGRIGVPRTQRVAAAAACARSVLHQVPEGDDRPRLAIEAAERWAADPTEANRKTCRDAYAAAYAASYTAYAAAAYAAAAYAAASAADYGADYGDYVADAAAYAYAYYAGKSRELCNLIRSVIKVSYKKSAAR